MTYEKTDTRQRTVYIRRTHFYRQCRGEEMYSHTTVRALVVDIRWPAGGKRTKTKSSARVDSIMHRKDMCGFRKMQERMDVPIAPITPFEVHGDERTIRGYAAPMRTKNGKSKPGRYRPGIMDHLGFALGIYSKQIESVYHSEQEFNAAIKAVRTSNGTLLEQFQNFRAAVLKGFLPDIGEHMTTNLEMVVMPAPATTQKAATNGTTNGTPPVVAPPAKKTTMPTLNVDVPPLIALMLESIAQDGPRTRAQMEAFATSKKYVTRFQAISAEIAYVMGTKSKWGKLFSYTLGAKPYVYTINMTELAKVTKPAQSAKPAGRTRRAAAAS